MKTMQTYTCELCQKQQNGKPAKSEKKEYYSEFKRAVVKYSQHFCGVCAEKQSHSNSAEQYLFARYKCNTRESLCKTMGLDFAQLDELIAAMEDFAT